MASLFQKPDLWDKFLVYIHVFSCLKVSHLFFLSDGCTHTHRVFSYSISLSVGVLLGTAWQSVGSIRGVLPEGVRGSPGAKTRLQTDLELFLLHRNE